MGWFSYTLGASALWSVCNFIDKLLIERFAPERKIAVLFSLYAAIFSVLTLPVLLIIFPHTLDVTLGNALLFIGTGVIEVIAMSLYFRALQTEDTSTVVPFFQAIPIFSFILGFLLLGEMLTMGQILAGAVVILGGALLSYNGARGAETRFRTHLILLMLGASFCYALFDVIFKYGTIQEDFWTGVIWQHVGIILTALIILVVSKEHRHAFGHIIKSGGTWLFGLNMANEGLYAGGMMLSNFALTLAPVALVGLVNVYHPVLVFILGGLLTLFFPRLIKEDITMGGLFHKGAAIAIIVIGSVFLIS